MVSILPSERSGMDVLGRYLGQGASAAMPQMYENQRRQMGMKAFENAEAEIAKAGNDPYKIALALAKAGTQAPGMERALGPLIQTAMQNAVTKNAFPGQNPNGQPTVPGMPSAPPQGMEQIPMQGQAQGQPLPQAEQMPQKETPEVKKSEFATPSPFNVMTAPEIDAESQRYATAVRDPNAYASRQTQLNNQNTIATQQREALEDMALKAGIQPNELPRFMEVGSKFDPRNPAQWMLKAGREYDKIKSYDKQLEKAFIPGLGHALFGTDRKAALKKLEPAIQGLVEAGQEQEARKFLAEEYLSPTEVSLAIHPMTPRHEKAITALPKGNFPAVKEGVTFKGAVPRINYNIPKISYEEMSEKNPQELQKQENVLSDFFKNNIDKDTSILGLREKLWEDKDYDWRQIGPAIRKAQKEGLKLEPHQETEMVDVETQAPIQSLPEMFQSWDRFKQKIRGNR